MNAIAQIPPNKLQDGVHTCSAGNFGQGVAWAAQNNDIPCTVFCPETTPAVKVESMRRLGADVRLVPYDTWWSMMTTRNCGDINGTFLHPVCSKSVIAGKFA